MSSKRRRFSGEQKAKIALPAQAKALWNRFEFVYTPKHGSRSNVAEVELNVMIRQCLSGEPEEIARLIRSEKPRLVRLDLMLPGANGIELMAQVPKLSDLPVIFISGYGRDETIARAFKAGAVDYIVKPFSPTELTARIGAALRSRTGTEPFVLGELVIDYERRRVMVGQRAVALTATEYELLRILSVNAGRVVTTDSLLRQGWGARNAGDGKSVRAFVMKLRSKLGDDAASPTYIFNERGVG